MVGRILRKLCDSHLLLSIYPISSPCFECVWDRWIWLIPVIKLCYKVKGFCRGNWDDKSIEFEVIKREIYLGGLDLISERDTRSFLKRNSLQLALKKYAPMCPIAAKKWNLLKITSAWKRISSLRWKSSSSQHCYCNLVSLWAMDPHEPFPDSWPMKTVR